MRIKRKPTRATVVSSRERELLIEQARKDGQSEGDLAALEMGVICQNFLALVQYGQRLGASVQERDGNPVMEDVPFKELQFAYEVAHAFVQAFGDTVDTPSDAIRRLRWLSKQVNASLATKRDSPRKELS